MTLRKQAAVALPFVAGSAGILIPIVAFLGIGLGLQAASWFSWIADAVSDLGISSVSAGFFNNGMIYAGVLMFVFAFGIYRVVSRKMGVCLGVASGALIGIGLVPETMFVPHWVCSGCFFVSLAGCFLFCSLDSVVSPLLQRSGRSLTVLAFVSGGLIIVFPGVAIPELLLMVPGFFWCAGVGVGALILPALAQKKTRKYNTPAMTG